MRMRFIIAACFGMLTTSSVEAETMPLKMVSCNEMEQYTSLRFESGSANWKIVTFMDASKAFALQSRTVKGTLEWNNVSAIRLEPAASKKFLLAQIDYLDTYDGSHKSFEMGLISTACLTRLEKRYDKLIKFVRTR